MDIKSGTLVKVKKTVNDLDVCLVVAWEVDINGNSLTNRVLYLPDIVGLYICRIPCPEAHQEKSIERWRKSTIWGSSAAGARHDIDIVLIGDKLFAACADSVEPL